MKNIKKFLIIATAVIKAVELFLTHYDTLVSNSADKPLKHDETDKSA